MVGIRPRIRIECISRTELMQDNNQSKVRSDSIPTPFCSFYSSSPYLSKFDECVLPARMALVIYSRWQ